MIAGGGRYPAYREITVRTVCSCSITGGNPQEIVAGYRNRRFDNHSGSDLYRPKAEYLSAVGKVQVDLEQANPDLVASERRMPTASDPSYFNTQLQLLYSDSLLRRVIKEHSLDSNKEFQLAKTEQSVSPWTSMLRAVGLASDDRKKEEKGIGEVSQTANSTLASSEEVSEAIRLAPFVQILQRNLNIEPVREGRATIKDTRLIEVSFRHSNPELAAFIVNGIIETLQSKSGKTLRHEP